MTEIEITIREEIIYILEFPRGQKASLSRTEIDDLYEKIKKIRGETTTTLDANPKELALSMIKRFPSLVFDETKLEIFVNSKHWKDKIICPVVNCEDKLTKKGVITHLINSAKHILGTLLEELPPNPETGVGSKENESVIINHNSDESGEGYRCTLGGCNLTFKTKAELGRHKREEHTN